MISLKQIHYALAVEQTRHFKRAADECSVSQSALSTAIAEMEAQLGMQVFERNTKKVLITPEGELFLEKAHQIKLLLDDIHLLSSSKQGPLCQKMTVGVIPTIGPYLLPMVLPALRKRYPHLELRIVEYQSAVLLEKVRQGEIDTAIIALPYDVDGLHVFEFWQEDFFLVAHRSLPICQQDSVGVDDIKKMDVLLLEDGHCLKDQALAICQLEPARIDKTVAATSLYTLIQMAAGKMGATLVPEMAVKQSIDGDPELKALRLVESGPHRKIAFVTRLNYPAVKNIEAMMSLFKETLTAACS